MAPLNFLSELLCKLRFSVGKKHMIKKHNPEYPASQRSYEFLRLARQFHEAYVNCVDISPMNTPKYFLGCHAIELALKSYLLMKGVDIEDCYKKYGHSIKKALNKCLKLGLILDENDITHLKRLDKAHSLFWNRYPIECAPEIYVVDQNDIAIANLLKAVDPYQRYGPIKYD